MDKDLEYLIDLMGRLPGLGKRSARRIVLHLLKKKDQQMVPLGQALIDVSQKLKDCVICGNVDTQNVCSICVSNERAKNQICLVENLADLWAIERGRNYFGQYHVLGGVLSAIGGMGPEELRIPKLIERIKSQENVELISALSPTVEGQSTLHYILDCLENTPVHITQLGQGLPMGSHLDYLDDGTLRAAFKTRQKVDFHDA